MHLLKGEGYVLLIMEVGFSVLFELVYLPAYKLQHLVHLEF